MGKQPNRTCPICGKQYYACPTCIKFGGWRAVACSPKCYKELLHSGERQNEEAKQAGQEPMTMIEIVENLEKENTEVTEVKAQGSKSKKTKAKGAEKSGE